ncbi:Lipase 5 [Talaromyces pinophilus]|nr:Lipase 5 [Talaromyces pinophilus]
MAFYNADYFPGMSFAQPPTGDLRLALPVSLNSSFETRNATELGPGCNEFPEDCLSVNVYRPSGYENEKRSVLVLIYGNSVDLGMPLVAASINYRLTGFGFLDSPEIHEAGLSNLGLRNQRLALHWIQENIDAFGGDPSKVTIWRQSAGAMSIGPQILAFGGRNDSLSRAVIADNGGLLVQPPTTNASLATGNSIVNLTGWAPAQDKIRCLRSVSLCQYTDAVNHTSGSYAPVYDGDFLPTMNSVQVKSGEFLKGYVRNSSQVDSALGALSIFCPDISSIGTPSTHHGRLNATFGAQYARVAALAGDLIIHRGCRLCAQSWVQYGIPVYSYTFAAWPIEVYLTIQA